MCKINFFNNDKSFNKKFKLKNENLINIGTFQEGEERKENKTLSIEEVNKCIRDFGLEEKNYYKFRGDKILIKGFTYEKNIDIYNFLWAKEEEICKGIEVLNLLNLKAEIKFASGIIKDKFNFKKPSNEIIEFNKKKLLKEYFSDIEPKDILIIDLLDIVCLGKVFLTGEKVDFAYLPVFGEAVNGGQIVKVKNGTTLREIFNTLEGREESLSKIVVGGVITGSQKASLDEVIRGDEKGILFLTKAEEKRGATSPCIRCSKCLRICQEGLNPIKLSELWERDLTDEFIKFGGDKCTSCGLCSYICPSNIELSHKIYTAKKSFIKEDENIEVRSEQFV